jgi:ABC-type nickel/cobalt efflux system permease component RcnA
MLWNRSSEYEKELPMQTMSDMFVLLNASFTSWRQSMQTVENVGFAISSDEHSKNGSKFKSFNKKQHQAKASNPPNRSLDSADRPSCRGCGRAHGGICRFRDHPDFNKTQWPWSESPNGIAFAARNQ